MMEAVRTSEASVYSNETIWSYIAEDSKLHTRCRENLKSHKFICCLEPENNKYFCNLIEKFVNRFEHF
jgi:hypothetical protein